MRATARSVAIAAALLLGLSLGDLAVKPAGASSDDGYRLVHALLSDDVRFVIWPTVGGVVIGVVISTAIGRRRRAPRST